jgi:acetyltransferase-like isoleucine patch superfamily enzyme
MKFFLIFKLFRKIYYTLKSLIDKLRCNVVFWGNNVMYNSFKTTGVPYVSVAIGGSCVLGENLNMNNGAAGSPIGCFQPCTIFVDKGARLEIGINLGISQAAIVCYSKIVLGDNIKIGGGVCIYDTDFHSLDYKLRSNSLLDSNNKISKPIYIDSNVFIGAHSIILKGVHIGENSIIGASSVVTKNVPANQIWAGNPAKFIREV